MITTAAPNSTTNNTRPPSRKLPCRLLIKEDTEVEVGLAVVSVGALDVGLNDGVGDVLGATVVGANETGGSGSVGAIVVGASEVGVISTVVGATVVGANDTGARDAVGAVVVGENDVGVVGGGTSVGAIVVGAIEVGSYV